MLRKKKHHPGKKIFPTFIGTVQMTREGFAFVRVEGEDEDIFVPASKTRGALNGDLVRVSVTKEKAPATKKSKSTKEGRREGCVVDVLERSEKPFIGIFHSSGKGAWVLMQSRVMPYDIEVDPEQAKKAGAEKGWKVSVRVEHWNKGESLPFGKIIDVLGAPGENETEMHSILAEFGLPYRFEPELEKAAEKISDKIKVKDIKERRDFRDTFTFTIDPEDAKDFDDALSFKPLENGNFEVGVHIADVSHYVTPGSDIDREARDRGTSVYLADRTVPMLPEKLCNRLCSLRPNEEKLCFSAVFEITPRAAIRKKWFGRTVIKSNFRLTYEQAQDIIEGIAENPDTELQTAITVLNKLAGILKGKRRKAGAIDFSRPEMKVLCDETGRPIDVYQKISKEANWLIEEFMLLANRSVAEFVAATGKTFVYRVHDVPNPEKLESLRHFAKSLGYKMNGELEGKKAAGAISDLLDKATGKPEAAAFKDIALRSMAKAKYSTENIGHYGLAFADYTHFTSPIRRYPDLMVHRLLALYLDNTKSQDREFYESECKYASGREALASEAERTSVKYKVVEFMQDKVGQEFVGHISGLTEWGMYVEIEPTHIEGMVALRSIKSDFFEFDEKLYRIKGRRTRKVYRLGDEVRIRVSNTNLEQRLLDYELVEERRKAS
ncbi:MAG: ribonuclease R [Candidatus Cryptobacteroides sp.]|nr:ribonuclease R [Candidatus Cryptobacteroides sp.]